MVWRAEGFRLIQSTAFFTLDCTPQRLALRDPSSTPVAPETEAGWREGVRPIIQLAAVDRRGFETGRDAFHGSDALTALGITAGSRYATAERGVNALRLLATAGLSVLSPVQPVGPEGRNMPGSRRQRTPQRDAVPTCGLDR